MKASIQVQTKGRHNLLVELIKKGDTIGLREHNKAEPLVSFGAPYTYFVSSIIDRGINVGLCLDGADHSYDLDASEMARVINWLKTEVGLSQWEVSLVPKLGNSDPQVKKVWAFDLFDARDTAASWNVAYSVNYVREVKQ